MGMIGKIVSGMGVLIAIYLLIADHEGTTSVINSLANATTGTVKTLQGRG